VVLCRIFAHNLRPLSAKTGHSSPAKSRIPEANLARDNRSSDYRGIGIGNKTADSADTAEPGSMKERIPEKAAFPPQPQIELLRGDAGRETYPTVLVS
jgi:hypothetical protein